MRELIRNIFAQSICGVLIMASVSAAWVGATHLLKWTFRAVSVVVVVDRADNQTQPGAVSSATPPPVDVSRFA